MKDEVTVEASHRVPHHGAAIGTIYRIPAPPDFVQRGTKLLSSGSSYRPEPAPVMRAYVAARAAAERAIAEAGLTATILRPWYVLGPGHRWPIVLLPVYALAGLIPAWRAGARRLGLVTIAQMVAALAHSVENPPAPGARRIVEVPAIRSVDA